MKKYSILLIIFSLFTGINITFANNTAIEIKINETNNSLFETTQTIDFEKSILFFADLLTDTPESYKYIEVKYLGVTKGSKYEDALKKLIYHNTLPNTAVYIDKNKALPAHGFYTLAGKVLNITTSGKTKETLGNRMTNESDFQTIKESYYIIERSKKYRTNSLFGNDIILNDVYKTITSEHFNKKNISQKDLMNGMIQGLAKGTNDKHTVYFPPVENKSFQESLSGDFEGIGAYVELPEPGLFKIGSPIPGGPAEKAGLKGGDIVLKVDDNEITKENSSSEIISWIKGKAGTYVTLKIQRGTEKLDIKVKREKIHISALEYKVVDGNTYYIKIKTFSDNVGEEFKGVLKEIEGTIGVKKIIFDLRNNGGGYLEEVSKMLGYFIKKGENVAVIKYIDSQKEYTSSGDIILDLNKYKIIILQNSGTASASEIMIGALKDYFENVTVIGEKSYGKGSVQSIKSYIDGSSFKYTVAKWYTGKTETGIDGVGITPDIQIELNIDEYKKTGYDNQYEKALEL